MDRADRERMKQELLRLADGDRSAFEPVYARMLPILRRFIGDQVPDAEDVAQQALLNAFARVAEFDPDRDAYAWILGIAAFEVKTSRKRAARRKEVGAEAAVDLPTGWSTEEALVNAELRGALQQMVGQLAPADAEALWAWAGIGERPVEGATFRKRVQRAMTRLKFAWRQAHGDE